MAIRSPLSGGERRRVARATAHPILLLLDEMTNHLDAESVWWLGDSSTTTRNGRRRHA
jgi:ATPase subunit of ABC transporter with duplicated ATPase domains